MIDFHTHLLPSIDDGSRSVEETRGILRVQQQHGINTIVATSHFYPDQNIEEFVQIRKEAKQKIEEELQRVSVQLKLGAEVLLGVDTCRLEQLEALCIEGTKYILIELPYIHWYDWVYTGVQNIIDNKRLIPILAHIERYEDVMVNPNCLIPFAEMGCLFQVNTTSLYPKSIYHKLAMKLAKHGFIHLIGSDVHRANDFHPISLGYEILIKGVGKEVVENMHHIGQAVLENKEITISIPQPFKKRFGRWY